MAPPIESGCRTWIFPELKLIVPLLVSWAVEKTPPSRLRTPDWLIRTVPSAAKVPPFARFSVAVGPAADPRVRPGAAPVVCHRDPGPVIVAVADPSASPPTSAKTATGS